MTFQPGNKLALGKGRPTIRNSVADAMRRKFPPDKIAEMAEKLYQETDDDRVRLGILVFLAERTGGKPRQGLDGELTFAEGIKLVASMTPEQRAQWLASLRSGEPADPRSFLPPAPEPPPSPSEPDDEP